MQRKAYCYKQAEDGEDGIGREEDTDDDEVDEGEADEYGEERWYGGGEAR